LVFASLFPAHDHADDVQDTRQALLILECKAIDSLCQLRASGKNGFDVRRIRCAPLNPRGQVDAVSHSALLGDE
jgi:hypothetical protein